MIVKSSWRSGANPSLDQHGNKSNGIDIFCLSSVYGVLKLKLGLLNFAVSRVPCFQCLLAPSIDMTEKPPRHLVRIVFWSGMG